MSPSWVDRLGPLRIALAPGRVALTGGGIERVVEHGTADWTGALAALDAALAAVPASGRRAEVVLSHHFARLYLLAPPAVWLRPDEMRAWLDERLAEALPDPRAWHLVWDDGPPGRTVTVAAMPRAALDELRTLLVRHRLRARSLRPWLARLWQRRGRALRRYSGWLGMLEPGRLLLARIERGRLASLCQRRLGAQPALELAGHVARQALLTGAPAHGPIWLDLAGVRDDWQNLGGGLAPRILADRADATRGLLA